MPLHGCCDRRDHSMHFFSIGMVQTKLSSQAARFHTFGQERLEGMHFFR